jgi:hypothetical protein
MPTGSAALPWWVDALLIFMAVVIFLTLVWLLVEIIRNFSAGRRTDLQPADRQPTPSPGSAGAGA